ncbi:MAG: hypothetical protein WD336_09885 [Trueperaceae bacterium]
MTKPRSVRAWTVVAVALLALTLVVAGCRNETQNRLRRSIQDLSSTRMHITVHALSGDVVFEGVVDGMVSRSNARGTDGEAVSGSFIYWYDERGRYHQTGLPYLVTSYDRATTSRDGP